MSGLSRHSVLLAALRGPGRSPSSSSSSDAPPPVETWSTSSSRPNWASAAALSPPPTTVKPLVSAIAWATVRVPAANRSSSNMPIGPFQKTVRASMMTSPNAGRRAGTDVEALRAVGQAHAERGDVAAGVEADDVLREGGSVLPPDSESLEQLAAGLDLVGLAQRVADRVPLRGEEREAHRPADDQRVDDLRAAPR